MNKYLLVMVAVLIITATALSGYGLNRFFNAEVCQTYLLNPLSAISDYAKGVSVTTMGFAKINPMVALVKQYALPSLPTAGACMVFEKSKMNVNRATIAAAQPSTSKYRARATAEETQKDFKATANCKEQ